MTEPTPVTPIDADPADVTDRLGATAVPVPDDVLERIASSGATVVTDDEARAEAGRDWWPIAIGWATEGAVPQRPAAVVRPSSTDQVAAVLAVCQEAGVPVTPAAGRSGVCGGSIPVHGGIALDMTADAGLRRVDETSLTTDVRAGHLRPRPRSCPRGRGVRLHARALAPVHGPLDRGWVAGLPRRRAVLHPLRKDRGHGPRARGRAGRRPHRANRGQRPARRHRSQPDPALRRQRRHAGGDHRSAPAHPPTADRPGAARLRVRLVRAGPRGLPHDPPPRRHAGGAPPL